MVGGVVGGVVGWMVGGAPPRWRLSMRSRGSATLPDGGRGATALPCGSAGRLALPVQLRGALEDNLDPDAGERRQIGFCQFASWRLANCRSNVVYRGILQFISWQLTN